MATSIEMREQIYEGKAKVLFATSDPDLVIQFFKDDASAFNRKKLGTIGGKGVVNCRVSTVLFEEVERAGVPTHLVQRLSDREMLCRRLDMLKVEVVVRNLVAGSLAKRLAIPEGTSLPEPLFELYYKSDELDDPLVTEQQAVVLGWLTREQLETTREHTLAVNEVLKRFFAARNIRLVDFKLEFGVDRDGLLRLGDEISPDGCRLWDLTTGEKLDKDRFRRDLGGVEEAYRDVLGRVETEVAEETR